MPISLSPPCNAALDCIASCDPLPEVQFSLCNPEVYAAEVCELFLTTRDNPLADENDAAEWAYRMALPQSDPSKIISLKGKGEKPEPEIDSIEGAYGISKSSGKVHLIDFTISQLGDPNYEMMRYYERVKKGLGWFKTAGGKLYGGKGIPLFIQFNHLIPIDAASLEKLHGTLKWDDRYHPCRTFAVI